jgi:hypothetical protein
VRTGGQFGREREAGHVGLTGGVVRRVAGRSVSGLFMGDNDAFPKPAA